MRIDLFYYGAVAERYKVANNDTATENNPLYKEKIELGSAYEVTISDEIRELIQNENQPEVIFRYVDKDDPFWAAPTDQWLVFSQYLNDGHFFDSFSDEEAGYIESLFRNITQIVDNVAITSDDYIKNRGSMKRDIEKTINSDYKPPVPLNSYEAQLGLSSSTAALKYFSDNFLSGELKEGFDQLINKFVSHNEERIEASRLKTIEFFENYSKTNPKEAAMMKSKMQDNTKMGLSEFQKKCEELFDNIANEDDLNSTLSYLQELSKNRFNKVLNNINIYWGNLLLWNFTNKKI